MSIYIINVVEIILTVAMWEFHLLVGTKVLVHLPKSPLSYRDLVVHVSLGQGCGGPGRGFLLLISTQRCRIIFTPSVRHIYSFFFMFIDIYFSRYYEQTIV